MELMIVFATVFSFFLYLILISLFGGKWIVKKKRLDLLTKRQKVEMYAELEESFLNRFILPIFKTFSAAATRIIPKSKSQKSSGSDEFIKKQIRYAGLSMSVEEFTSYKIVFYISILLFDMLMLVLRMQFSLMILMFVASGFIALLLPSFYLKSKARKRQQMIQSQLPEVLDLLGVSIEAGLGFDAALLKISELVTGPLIEELDILHREIQMGLPRKQALKNFSECCDLAELKIFASSLTQAEQLGIPIKNVLSTQANQLRNARRQRAQEKGMKAPVKIMIPMVIFIFPVIFIILLGPTVVNLIKQFA